MNMPKIPLKSVSSHVLEQKIGNSLTVIKEVVLVVDDEGLLWRKEGSGEWKQL